MLKCYELISINIKKEQVLARPVAWDREIYDGEGNDIKGVQVEPIEFHATCPHCGNLVHFSLDDIYVGISGPDNVKCNVCGAADPRDLRIQSEDSIVEPNLEVFIDPIASGLFDLEVDLELLKKADLAEFS